MKNGLSCYTIAADTGRIRAFQLSAQVHYNGAFWSTEDRGFDHLTAAVRILVCLLVLSPALLAYAEESRLSGDCLLNAQAVAMRPAIDGLALLAPQLAPHSVVNPDCNGQRLVSLSLSLPLGRSQELSFHSGRLAAPPEDWQLLDSAGEPVAWASFHAGDGPLASVVLRLAPAGVMQSGQRFSGRIIFGQDGSSIPFELEIGEDSIFRENFDGLVEPMIGQFSFVH